MHATEWISPDKVKQPCNRNKEYIMIKYNYMWGTFYGIKFDYGVSRELFEETAIRVGKRTKRVKSIILTDDDILVGTCVSESGNSEWNFALVFDDFGHFTGEYRILSGNDQSEIPKRVGDAIKFQLKPYVHVPNSLRLKVECFLHNPRDCPAVKHGSLVCFE